MDTYGLEPTELEKWMLGDAVLKTAYEFNDDSGLSSQRLASRDEVSALVHEFLQSPDEKPGDLDTLLSQVSTAVSSAKETSGPRCYSYTPGSTLLSSAMGEFLSRVANRYTGFSSFAPALAAMEQGILRWMCAEFGLPEGAGGLFTTGASHSSITAFAAARMNRLGDDFSKGTVYLTRFTHFCAAKGLRIIGFSNKQIRVIPADETGRMDLAALKQQIAADRKEGWKPFLLVATAGLIDNGAIEPLVSMAQISRDNNLWFHIDAAYGGFFQLTARGKTLLHGINLADSIALDPHKSLFFPFGTGVLLMRDRQVLLDAYSADGTYLRDVSDLHDMPDRIDMGTEMTVEFRGLRMWLPLRLHGVDAFRAALDEKLDLAQYAYKMLVASPDLYVNPPELSTVIFRSIHGDVETQKLFETINSGGHGALSSTTFNGHLMIRVRVLNVGTHMNHVEPLINFILDSASRRST